MAVSLSGARRNTSVQWAYCGPLESEEMVSSWNGFPQGGTGFDLSTPRPCNFIT